MAGESLVQMLEEIAVGLKSGDEEIYGWLREQLKEWRRQRHLRRACHGRHRQALAGRGARQSRSGPTAHQTLGALDLVIAE
jgi:hypothetical protein